MPEGYGLVVVIVIVVLYLLSSIKILREYERGVIFRLGRVLLPPKVRESSWSSGLSTRSCASRCGRKCLKSRRRTSLPATTSPSR